MSNQMVLPVRRGASVNLVRLESRPFPCRSAGDNLRGVLLLTKNSYAPPVFPQQETAEQRKRPRKGTPRRKRPSVAQPGPVLLVQPGDGGPVQHPTENDVYVHDVFSSVRS